MGQKRIGSSTGKPRRNSSSWGHESDVQVFFMRWLRLCHPRLYEVTCSIPNGGLRTLQEGARQVKMGLKKGVPDLFCALPMGKWHGLWIEFKWGKNTLTKEQQQMITNYLNNGYVCGVCWTLDEAIETINYYLAGKAEYVRRRTIQILNREAHTASIAAMESGSRRVDDGHSRSGIEGGDLPPAA